MDSTAQHVTPVLPLPWFNTGGILRMRNESRMRTYEKFHPGIYPLHCCFTATGARLFGLAFLFIPVIASNGSAG